MSDRVPNLLLEYATKRSLTNVEAGILYGHLHGKSEAEMAALYDELYGIESQPPPKRNQLPAVQDLVMADMAKRKELGTARYGTPLQPFNGRNALKDLYEELLDACVYARQMLYEAGHDVVDVSVCGSCAGGDHACDHDGCACRATSHCG